MDRDLREKAYWKIVLHYKFVRDWENLYVYSEKFLKYNDSSGIRQLRELASQNRDPRITRIRSLMQEAQRQEKAGQLTEAAATYRAALHIKNDHQPARWELALVQIQLKEYRDAEISLRILIGADPGRWEYHYKAGVCNLLMDRHEDALRDMERARELNDQPGKSFVYFVNLVEGLAYLEREEFRRAREHFDAALEARSTARLRGALARAQWQLGEFAAAADNARRALRKEPDQPDALLVYALDRIRTGRPDAFAASRRVLDALYGADLGGLATPARFTPVMLYLGREAANRKDWPLALQAYERVNMKRLQAIHDAARQDGAALDHLRDYNYHFGLALFHADRLDQAIITLKRVDDSVDADYTIAQAYGQKSDAGHARIYLKKAAAARTACWQQALKDPAFGKLMQADSDFAFFVRNRGREPAPLEPLPDDNADRQTPSGTR
jgi:tetratricopeptide (TPR) repeat protein